MADLWHGCGKDESMMPGREHIHDIACFVPVEPAMVFTVRESFGRTVMAADEIPENLAHGCYALIPLEVKSDE